MDSAAERNADPPILQGKL